MQLAYALRCCTLQAIASNCKQFAGQSPGHVCKSGFAACALFIVEYLARVLVLTLGAVATSVLVCVDGGGHSHSSIKGLINYARKCNSKHSRSYVFVEYLKCSFLIYREYILQLSSIFSLGLVRSYTSIKKHSY